MNVLALTEYTASMMNAKGGITSSCGKPSPTVLTVYQSLL